MKRKIITPLLTICICLMICSCSKKLDLYKIYVVSDSNYNLDLDTGGIEYNKAENTYKMPSRKSSIKNNVPDKELQLGEETIILSYERTYSKEYCEYSVDRYSSNDYKIRATFRTDNGKLESLSTDNNYRIYDKPIEDEADLVKACTDYLMTYVGDRINYYNYAITTEIQKNDERGVDNDSVKEYISASEYSDSHVSYVVDFTYYIGEIKTGDIINICIDSNGYLGLLSFNMTGLFDSFSKLDVDTKLCNELISSELTKLCDIESYEYNGYTDEKIYVILDSKLCLLSYAQPVYKNVPGFSDDFCPMPVQLIIPVSK